MHTVFVACRARFQLGQPVPRGSDRMSFRPGLKLYFLSKLLLPGGNEQEKWVQQKLQQPLLLRRRRRPLVFFLFSLRLRTCVCVAVL